MDRIICLEAMFHFSSRQTFFNELTELEIPAFLFEAAMVDGYGPWPDFWQQEGDYQSMAESAGLQLSLQEDASLKTLPSYHFTAPNTDQEQYDSGDMATRAALTMHWLHRKGYLKYWYLCFTK
jgi:MPBQ/MSBQ methyltransferase